MITDDSPATWAEAINRLSSFSAPCPGFRGDEWSATVEACKDFMVKHAATAYRFGWTGIDLFAVHAVAGATRVDVCGALMLGGSRVQEVQQGIIIFERTRYFRTKPTPDQVLVWRFGKS